MDLSTKIGRDSKIHIYIDGEYKLTVDSDFWYLSKYFSMCEITDEQFEQMSEEIEKRRAFKKAEYFSMQRLYSKGEMLTKLREKNFSPLASSYAADKCEELGLINDEEFASIYADELLTRKHMGISRIILELKRKSISSEIIEEVVSKLECDETENIIHLLEKKYLNRLSDEKGRRSVFASLARLGYSYSDIKHAMEQYLEENDFDF